MQLGDETHAVLLGLAGEGSALHVFKIIQVGDVHYTDKENTTSPVDSNDAGFPGSLAAEIGTAPLQAVFRAIAQTLESEKPDLVAFMGDYTNRGDIIGLKDCVEYLRRLLPTDWSETSGPACQLLIGNHDVDRRKDPETDSRFDDINDAIRAVGFPTASVLAPEQVALTGAAGASLQAYGVNSSRGCGQIRRLGPLLAQLAGPTIARLLIEGNDEQLDEIYEGIDTPAIADETLHALRTSIARLPETALPVICAHHNLLPQTTPRLAPYSELVNAGAVREALLMLGRPVIFLHGHLHTDPVEVIRSPTRPGGAIVSISAPLLRDGFNEIAIAFNDEGVPLGCQVTRQRRSGSHVVPMAAVAAPIWEASEGFAMLSANGRKLLRKLEPDVRTTRRDLLPALAWPPETLDGAIEELRWLGLVHVQNPDRPNIHWRLTRAV